MDYGNNDGGDGKMNIKTRTIKSLIYRVYSFSITWFVMLLITRDINEANIFTPIIEVVKTLNFFLFDYVWDKIKKGKKL